MQVDENGDRHVSRDRNMSFIETKTLYDIADIVDVTHGIFIMLLMAHSLCYSWHIHSE